VRIRVHTQHATVRVRNQDRAVVATEVLEATDGVELRHHDPPVGIAVLDGLGGHPAGDVASDLAAHVIADAQLPRDERGAVGLLATVHRGVHEAAHRDPHLAGMGTTAVLAVIDGDGCLVVNVGDSTAFQHTGDALVELSVSDRGGSGALSQCLGGFDPEVAITAHTRRAALSSGDRLLLASDGLTDVVEPPTLEATLHLEAAEAMERLVAAVEDAGVPDDLTVVLAEV